MPQHLFQRPAPMRRAPGRAEPFDAAVLADDVTCVEEAVLKSALNAQGLVRRAEGGLLESRDQLLQSLGLFILPDFARLRCE